MQSSNLNAWPKATARARVPRQRDGRCVRARVPWRRHAQSASARVGTPWAKRRRARTLARCQVLLWLTLLTAVWAWFAAPAVVHAQSGAASIAADLALAIDDCPVRPAVPERTLQARAAEHYDRGEVLYLQGDYSGAILEFTASYCLVPYYTVLKDIGQAYERELDYQRAIAYFQRYLAAVPLDAKRSNSCAPEPAVEKRNVAARIAVLSALPARVNVTTEPVGAEVVLSSENGVVARGRSGGELIEVAAGTYQMQILLAGHVPMTQKVTVEVGKPYGFFFALTKQKGSVSIVAVPETARIFVDEKLVGVGAFAGELTAGVYQVRAEAAGFVAREQRIEVLPQQELRVVLQPRAIPESGATQAAWAALLLGGAFFGALPTNTDTQVVAATGGALFAGTLTFAFVPKSFPLGTSSLTITAGIAGGAGVGWAAQTLNQKSARYLSGGIVLGVVTGYAVGRSINISPGDAAIINSGVVWGGAAGMFFAQTFSTSDRIGAGISLSGLTVGALSAALLSRQIDISRRHMLIIDAGAAGGMLSGLVLRSSLDVTGDDSIAHYGVGGMIVGIATAALLTRGYDDVRVPRFAPTFGAASSSDGEATIPTFGIGGSW